MSLLDLPAGRYFLTVENLVDPREPLEDPNTHERAQSPTPERGRVAIYLAQEDGSEFPSGALVTVLDMDRRIVARTQTRRALYLDLSPGVYEFIAEASGFRRTRAVAEVGTGTSEYDLVLKELAKKDLKETPIHEVVWGDLCGVVAKHFAVKVQDLKSGTRFVEDLKSD